MAEVLFDWGLWPSDGIGRRPELLGLLANLPVNGYYRISSYHSSERWASFQHFVNVPYENRPSGHRKGYKNQNFRARARAPLCHEAEPHRLCGVCRRASEPRNPPPPSPVSHTSQKPRRGGGGRGGTCHPS